MEKYQTKVLFLFTRIHEKHRIWCLESFTLPPRIFFPLISSNNYFLEYPNEGSAFLLKTSERAKGISNDFYHRTKHGGLSLGPQLIPEPLGHEFIDIVDLLPTKFNCNSFLQVEYV